MGRVSTSPRVRCHTLALVTLTMILGACGLNQRERAVHDVNRQIEAVYQVSEDLASAIYQLPDRPTSPESFNAVITAYDAYRTEVNRLNVLIHRLGGIVPELNDHLRDQFDPEAEEALNRCDEAVGVFERSDADEQEYQQALTAMCLCIERYAGAVTAVSQVYARIAS